MLNIKNKKIVLVIILALCIMVLGWILPVPVPQPNTITDTIKYSPNTKIFPDIRGIFYCEDIYWEGAFLSVGNAEDSIPQNSIPTNSKLSDSELPNSETIFPSQEKLPSDSSDIQVPSEQGVTNQTGSDGHGKINFPGGNNTQGEKEGQIINSNVQDTNAKKNNHNSSKKPEVLENQTVKFIVKFNPEKRTVEVMKQYSGMLSEGVQVRDIIESIILENNMIRLEVLPYIGIEERIAQNVLITKYSLISTSGNCIGYRITPYFPGLPIPAQQQATLKAKFILPQNNIFSSHVSVTGLFPGSTVTAKHYGLDSKLNRTNSNSESTNSVSTQKPFVKNISDIFTGNEDSTQGQNLILANPMFRSVLQENCANVIDSRGYDCFKLNSSFFKETVDAEKELKNILLEIPRITNNLLQGTLTYASFTKQEFLEKYMDEIIPSEMHKPPHPMAFFHNTLVIILGYVDEYLLAIATFLFIMLCGAVMFAIHKILTITPTEKQLFLSFQHSPAFSEYLFLGNISLNTGLALVWNFLFKDYIHFIREGVLISRTQKKLSEATTLEDKVLAKFFQTEFSISVKTLKNLAKYVQKHLYPELNTLVEKNVVQNLIFAVLVLFAYATYLLFFIYWCDLEYLNDFLFYFFSLTPLSAFYAYLTCLLVRERRQVLYLKSTEEENQSPNQSLTRSGGTRTELLVGRKNSAKAQPLLKSLSNIIFPFTIKKIFGVIMFPAFIILCFLLGNISVYFLTIPLLFQILFLLFFLSSESSHTLTDLGTRQKTKLKKLKEYIIAKTELKTELLKNITTQNDIIKMFEGLFPYAIAVGEKNSYVEIFTPLLDGLKNSDYLVNTKKILKTIDSSTAKDSSTANHLPE